MPEVSYVNASLSWKNLSTAQDSSGGLACKLD